jgi:hypothetical protein
VGKIETEKKKQQNQKRREWKTSIIAREKTNRVVPWGLVQWGVGGGLQRP